MFRHELLLVVIWISLGLELVTLIADNVAPHLYSTTIMTDTTSRPALPDRLSVHPRSPFHVADIFNYDIGIRFNGKDRFDVEEYCVSEGWIKVPAGKAVDRRGQPLLMTLRGVVEAYYRDQQ